MVGGVNVVKKVEAFDALNKAYTVADGTQVSKGIWMVLSDPRTAAAASAAGAGLAGGVPIAGISNTEKKADDGQTELGLWTAGNFDAVASGAITAGNLVVPIVDNYVAAATSDLTVASMAMIGRTLRAEETASDGETIEVEMR